MVSEELTLTTIIIAIIYILYGVIKIVIGTCILVLTPEEISEIPILHNFKKEAGDKSLAGRMYEYILMAFGVYTIVHGCILFNLLPTKFVKIFEHKVFQYGILIILGLIMTIFYICVLYTNLPIDKNIAYTDHYLIIGLVGGISFLIMPPGWELIEYISPYFRKLPFEQQNLWIIGAVIVIAVIAELVYIYYTHASDKSTTKAIINSKIEEVTSATSHIKEL